MSALFFLVIAALSGATYGQTFSASASASASASSSASVNTVFAQNMHYLFERLGEPLALPKGNNEDVLFNVPQEFLPERYRKKINTTDLGNRGFSSMVNIPTIKNLPDISEQLQLDRHEQFSTFIPKHRRIASNLMSLLLRQSTDDFFATSAYCRDKLNRFMYTYAMSVATLHRPDTRNVQLPLLASVLPEKFFDGAIFARAREEANLVNPEDRLPLEIPPDYTASDLEPEHRVAYFREDVGINLHHWHWHLTYPHNGPIEIVRKDRRGELFYYMHQQILGRFNFERFSNRLGRANRFNNWREAIPEGYFPKLDSIVASRVWPPRQAGAILQDLSREDFELDIDVQDLERWRDRIFEAIHNGRVQAEDGSIVPLDERIGIDILGNIVENSNISINPNLYGDLHNMGHNFISMVHDPDHRHLESFGVMGDATTAMRDPVFYRWHAFINDVFTEHKKTLPPYTTRQLAFDGISVLRADVLTSGLSTPNEFNTFWQQDDIDLSRGLDFVPRGPVLVRVTHLQHTPFIYRILVQNDGPPRVGTVRIFMSPRFDERGTPLKFRDQRNFFIEMDKFTYRLATGGNTIDRPSTASSVTIPWERTFRDLNAAPTEPSDAQQQFFYCGCGWPQHMLVPKGTADGFPVDLFVMVTNYADDMVTQPNPIPNICSDGHSLCGIRSQLYPDRKPMGFPFDRLPRAEATTLQRFLTPNMRVTPVVIRFIDRTEPPPGQLDVRSGGN